MRHRVVGPLNRHHVGRVEDHAAPPAVVVGVGRRHRLAVQAQLDDLPDAVHRRARPAVALRGPEPQAQVREHDEQIEAGQHLQPGGDAAARRARDARDALDEQRARRLAPEEEVHQPRHVGGHQHRGHQNQVEGELLEAEVVGHVQHQHLQHVEDAQPGAQHRGAGHDEQQAGCHLRDARQHLVGRGGADERPQQIRERQAAHRLHQRHERRRLELRRDHLRHPVIEHLRRQHEAEREPEPGVERGLVHPGPVRCRPRGRGRARHDHDPRELDPVEGRVAAVAGEDERGSQAGDGGGQPQRDVTERPHVPERRQRGARQQQHAAGQLRGQGIEAEVQDAEAEREAASPSTAGQGRRPAGSRRCGSVPSS